MSPKPRHRILLLDGHSLAYRAFFALPPDLRTTSGQVTNAVYGFTSMLIKALQELKTEHVAVAFDRGAPSERLQIRPEYKAQRKEPPDEFNQQMGLIREVLKALRVPMFEIDNVEADDIIHVVGTSLAAAGHDVIIVTADRDFFQMVAPNVKVLMNRRGISDTVLYDEAGIRQRYGFGPSAYLDYAALRGDPSDNIAGVPGVGDKTAMRLIQEHATLEAVFAHLDELTPRLRTNLSEARERLLENREFFRLRTAEELAAAGAGVSELEVSADEIRMGPWDQEEIRRLFDTLEFRTLFERLATIREAAPAALGPGFEAHARTVGDEEGLAALREALAAEPSPVVGFAGDPARPRDSPAFLAFKTGAGIWTLDPARFGPALRDAIGGILGTRKLVAHRGKDLLLRLSALGLEPEGLAMDTELAAYLIDPARGAYPLDELCRIWLQRDLHLPQAEEEPGEPGGQQALALGEPQGAGERDAAVEVLAVSELAPVLEKELRERGAWELFSDLELPLAGVLAAMERAGIRVDVQYLGSLASALDDELATIERRIYSFAGEPFNISSPTQLRRILYEKLGLKPSKRTKTGFSTDAAVLETLREEHPIVDAILSYREKAKLKSTYIDALPPLVDPSTGRVHCRFAQAVAATGRLSSNSPNLQNIPIRTEEGRQIRRAFVPADGHLLVTADYSQIELRILAHLSGDPELKGAFERNEDVHRRSIAAALGIEESAVTPELRSIGKMVSYGVTYGMGPFGLAQRLHIPIEQARTYIAGFFGLYPRVREYLDEVVAKAASDGFTTTILGRRRYVPELQARNPRVRSLGERMALNAPIQGSAADVLKLAMVRVAAALEGSHPRTRMLLTVHDEIVLESPGDEAAAAAGAVREAMEGVIALDVPLVVDVAAGENWADAKG